MKTMQKFSAAAGGLSLAVALFQAAISFSPVVSIYFGAPDEIASDPALLLASGLTAAVIFAVFGLYGLSGAGLIRRMPLLRAGLLAAGIIFFLRGLAVIPVILVQTGLMAVEKPLPAPALISSIVPLAIGLLYLAGTFGGWRDLSPSAD
jgi:hypothetical protein